MNVSCNVIEDTEVLMIVYKCLYLGGKLYCCLFIRWFKKKEANKWIIYNNIVFLIHFFRGEGISNIFFKLCFCDMTK
jgi:hypothetical protein